MRRRDVKSFLSILVIAPVILLSRPAPGAAQAGSAVAVTPTGEVLVLRPTSGRGAAGVLVFRRGPEGGWVRTASLAPGEPAEPYEGFGFSLAAGDGIIAAAGGDDDATWGARPFVREADGAWLATAPVAVEPGLPPEVPTRPGGLDMAGLMRIMQPPARMLALSPDGQTMALWAAGAEAGTVRVLRRETDGGWRHVAALPVRTPAGQGTAQGPAVRDVRLVVRSDRLVVGDPGRPPGGAVRFFMERDGQWVLDSELTMEDSPNALFGAALALRDDRLAVGMPRASKVALFDRADGEWTRAAGIPAGGAAETGDPAGAFGVALAWTDAGLWVGAPIADDGRGAVHRFEEDPGTGTWRPAERFTPADTLEEGGALGFGLALAGAGDVVVAGAPLARAGGGRAAVIERRDGAWRGLTWLDTGTDLASVTDAEVRCQDGAAAGFDCRDVDLLSYLALPDLGAAPHERVSDIWGWADPETGREYALVGRTAGMAIVDVTRPSAPDLVGIVRANPSGARDIKVYRDHAFFTGDGAGAHGLVVFDLRRVRALPAEGPADLEPDVVYGEITSAHNLVMETETGIAIPVGASGGGRTCGGGLHMVDVSTPTEPVFAGCYTDTGGLIAPGRTHDAQCVIYRGPDRDYRGRRVCLASNETALRIVDITDPAAPIEVARAVYPAIAYAHQGWLTEDHRYFFMNDELDELVGLAERTRTLIWDIADLDDPVLAGEHLGPDAATDHNLFIRGDRMYQANYQGGFRVVDISDPEAPRDVGSFDTTPYGSNPPGFGSGAWTAYPFLPSGTILVSSMYEGLFILRPRPGPVP